MTTYTAWPALPPIDAWQPTFETIHRWTQIIGKIRLAHTPWINHSWHVPLYVTTRGLNTSPMFASGRAFEIDLDLLAHCLRITTADGAERRLNLEGTSVSDFYGRTIELLAELGIRTQIWTTPVEIPGPVEPFEREGRGAFDLGEFILPYEAVASAPDPDAALLAFLQSTYEAAATTARWDRPALEWGEGEQPAVRA